MRIAVVGAGIVGSACALLAVRAGFDVVVLDRGPVGGGTTSRGEGNLLVSDKAPGPELDLALRSLELWSVIAAELGAATIEYEEKGGLVVPTSHSSVPGLERFAAAQRGHGVVTEAVPDAHDLEPHLAPDLSFAVHYPQDAQVQPVRAAYALLAAARREGATVRLGVTVAVAHRVDGRVRGVVTTQGDVVEADRVVNAAGPWAGEIATALGVPVPVLPRRGFVLVTEPLPPLVRHKVYSADYVDNVASADAGLETSCVVEGTAGGTILVGASRERVGFDASMSVEVVRRLAAQAVRLYPVLADVALLRTYRGFRPYCPDHLPMIGPDPRDPGVVHACGHEGAGIGLAPATAELVVAHLVGADLSLFPAVDAVRPDRLVTSGEAV